MPSPISAAVKTIAGSGSFLNLSSNNVVPIAKTAVGVSVMDLIPSTITDPAIAPTAAAVMPSTKAIRPSRLLCFLKWGAAMTVMR